jgi:phage major head subunit gpT-like protein
MPISSNVPDFLVVGAQTGFLEAYPKYVLPWQQFTSIYQLDHYKLTLVDLGFAPMPTEQTGRPGIADFIERTVAVTPHDWHITVGVSQNAVDDDQTKTLDGKVRSAAERFPQHMNNLAFDALHQGNSTTSSYGKCYDGLAFFSASHVDKGAKYKTVQSNLFSYKALTVQNFAQVRASALAYLDDQGEPTYYNPNMILSDPSNEYNMAQITNNKETGGTANREMNPFEGKTSFAVSPKLVSGEAYYVAAGESVKPIVLVMRKAPYLQDAWFDPLAPDGGMFFFKFFARYWLCYGDWRLASKVY